MINLDDVSELQSLIENSEHDVGFLTNLLHYLIRKDGCKFESIANKLNIMQYLDHHLFVYFFLSYIDFNEEMYKLLIKNGANLNNNGLRTSL